MASNREDREGTTSVPQFGAWDQQAGLTSYSVVFSKARARRRRAKEEGGSVIGLGSSEELESPQAHPILPPPPISFQAPPPDPNECVPQTPSSPGANHSLHKEDYKTGVRQFMKGFKRYMKSWFHGRKSVGD